jgi:hypothetical protein
MSEIYAFTASQGRNGLIDVFAIGDFGSDHNGTAVFHAQAAPGQQWPPWANLGTPGVGAVAVQSITGPDRYGHLLARSGGNDLWVRMREDNDDFSDWTKLGVPPPAAPDDPMVFGWMSGATTGLDNGTVDVVGVATTFRPGTAMFIWSRLDPGIPWSDWIALPENDSAAAGPISCIADDDRGLDIVTWVNLMLPGEVIQPGLCHLRRRPDSYWTDWEMIDFVEGGFNPDIAPVLAYGGGGEDLNLFAVATDNTVWHSVATKDGWSEWLSLGDPGAPVTSIAAIEDADSQLNLFAIRQDNVVTVRRQEGQAGAWWPWINVPIAADPITSYAVILDNENCVNLFLGRPGNQGIDIFRQEEGPDSAFVSGPSLPALPI